MTHRTDDPRLERLQGTLDMLILSAEHARVNALAADRPAGPGLAVHDAAGLVNFLPGEAEDFVFPPAGVVDEVEDVLPRGGQVGANGKVFGVLEEALAGVADLES